MGALQVLSWVMLSDYKTVWAKLCYCGILELKFRARGAGNKVLQEATGGKLLFLWGQGPPEGQAYHPAASSDLCGGL